MSQSEMDSKVDNFGDCKGLGVTGYFSIEIPENAMILVHDFAGVLPVGTPKEFWATNGAMIKNFRGEVNHFHCENIINFVPAGWDPDGFSVAFSEDEEEGKEAIREMLEKHPPVDPTTQKFRLRNMVRPGD